MRNLTRPSQFKRSPGFGYAVAALAVTAAVIANHLLGTYLHAAPTLFLFLCAIMFAAWFGGGGPGLAATTLSILAFDYFFLLRSILSICCLAIYRALPCSRWRPSLSLD
jgi:K+-sensing histidine kinase KdpD